MPRELSERLQSIVGTSYRIELEITGGGMSRVFLANEPALKREVVIKVLPPDLVSRESLARFRREVEVTARLQHPHILPVITAGGEADLLYYVAPFIRGESLRARLASTPKLTLDEGGRLIAELLGAVAFAHTRGVVHRDIKPANVLLSEGHAILADFGIARALANPDDDQVTFSGTVIGTPVYMAPERPRDEHADLYAVAVMAYEMLTGSVPSQQRTLGSITAALVAAVPRSDAVIAKRIALVLAQALSRSPTRRFQSAHAFRDAWERSLKTDPPRSRLRLAVAIVVIAAVAVAGTIEWVRRRDVAVRSAGLGRIVVAPLQNFTGVDSLGVVGMMAGDWITEGLQKAGIVEVVPTTSAVQAFRYAAPDSSAAHGLLSPRVLAEETGAVTVVYGAIYKARNRLEFRVTVADQSGNRVVGSVTNVSAPVDDPLGGVEELRSRVMGWLAVRYDERLQAPASAVERPPTYDSYRAFSEAMTRYVAVENAGAAPLFLRAYRLDSSFTLALFYASISLTNQEKWGVADSLLRIIDRHRNSLSDYNRAWLDYRLAMNHGDPEAALTAIRSAARQAPETKSTYNYAIAALQSGHLHEALAAVSTLRPDRGAMRGYPPYWTVRTEILHALGQYDRERLVGDSARHAYPERMMSIAQFIRALVAEGRLDEMGEAVDQAKRMPTDSYNWDYGLVLEEAALELRAHGHQEEAVAYFLKARDWLKTNAREPGAGWRLVEVFHALGETTEARAQLNTLTQTDSVNIDYIGMSGLLFARSGNRVAALRVDTVLAAIPNQPFRAGLASLYRARIYALLGDRDSAMIALRKSFAEGRYWHLWIHRDIDLESLRGYEPFDQLVRGKD